MIPQNSWSRSRPCTPNSSAAPPLGRRQSRLKCGRRASVHRISGPQAVEFKRLATSGPWCTSASPAAQLRSLWNRSLLFSSAASKCSLATGLLTNPSACAAANRPTPRLSTSASTLRGSPSLPSACAAYVAVDQVWCPFLGCRRSCISAGTASDPSRTALS